MDTRRAGRYVGGGKGNPYSYNPRLGLLVAVGPWVLALVVLFITMLTSSYQ